MIRRIGMAALLSGALLLALPLARGRAVAGAPPVGTDVAAVVAKLLPSVVNITNISAGHALPGEVQGGLTILPKGRRSFGSGFIIDPRGYIATNRHVVIGSARLIVKLHDGTEHIARVVGEVNGVDMALLKIHSDHPLPQIVWSTGAAPSIGEPVMAIGNPLGLGESVSMGIISATDRNIGSSQVDHFLQTDAAINEGNSGGVLVNLKGHVIGMNTALYVPSGAAGGSVGLGFAMPSGDVAFLLGQLLTRHKLTVGWTGITAQPVNGWLARAFGLPRVEGALITAIDPGGPAAQAGLRPGDVVTAFNGAPLADPPALLRMAGLQKAGDVVRMTFIRDRAKQHTDLTIQNMPGDLAYIPPPEARRQLQPIDLGVTVAAITPDVRLALRLNPHQRGVLVTAVMPDGAGAELGAKVGNIVLQAGDVVVNTPAELEAAFAAARQVGESYMPLLVQSADGTLTWKSVPMFGYR